MVEFVSGDFFDYEANIRVNTVNCVGVMGAGVALEFKQKYPAMFKAYVKACKNKEIKPGVPHVYDASNLFGQCVIINFPTKTDWRLPSKYEYIESGLIWLRDYLQEYDEECKVTLPALGCGHGGLDWNQVKTLINQYLNDLNCHVYAFPPASSNSHFDNAYFSDELDKCGAIMVTAKAEDYFKNIGEERAFFIKGNRDNLSRRKIHILVSKTKDIHVFEREFEAIRLIAEEVRSYDFAFSISVSSNSDRNWAIKLLELGFSVIAFVNEGIIRAVTNDVYEPYWSRLTLVSFETPNSTYKKTTMKNNERGSKVADAVILCNSDLDDIRNNSRYIMPVLVGSTNAFYIKFWSGSINTLADNNIQAIGMNAQTRKPNVECLEKALNASR